jgi:hypothetical protein
VRVRREDGSENDDEVNCGLHRRWGSRFMSE